MQTELITTAHEYLVANLDALYEADMPSELSKLRFDLSEEDILDNGSYEIRPLKMVVFLRLLVQDYPELFCHLINPSYYELNGLDLTAKPEATQIVADWERDLQMLNEIDHSVGLTEQEQAELEALETRIVEIGVKMIALLGPTLFERSKHG